MNRQGIGVLVVAGVMALGLSACGGGGSSTPSQPSPTPSPTPPSGSNATVTITANGVNPANVTIPVNGRVTFVNNDSRAHEMTSDPHPVHTDCPPLNVGLLQPGQSRDTAAFPAARTCGFHDHLDPERGALQGTVRIQ